jgi:hypothetical protein
MATVIKNTPNLDKLKKRLKNPEIGLKEASLYVASTTITRWNKGKGLDNIDMLPLTDEPEGKGYKTKKTKGEFKNQVSRSGKPNMKLTGNMQNKLGVEKLTKTTYKVGWGDAKEQKKANGNQNKRTNMMKVNKLVANKATKIFNEWLKS